MRTPGIEDEPVSRWGNPVQIGHPSRVVFALYVVAFLARFAAACMAGFHAPAASDEVDYYDLATSLLRGEGYAMVVQQSADGIARPTAYRMPGPALVMALGMWLFGHGPGACRVVAVAVSSLSAPLMFLFARTSLDRRPALLAGLGCALYPTWVFYSATLLSEPYFLPMLLLSLIATTHGLRSRSAGPTLAAGMSWGMTTWIRPHALPMAALIAGYLAWRSGWRRGAALVLGTAIALAPWAVRNLAVMGAPVLLGAEGGETFLGSNNPYVFGEKRLHGMWLSPMAIPEYSGHLRPIQDELERNREQYSMGMKYLRRNLGRVPALVFYKWTRWLTPVTVTPGKVRWLVLGSYGLLLISLLYGAARGIFRASTGLHLVLLCSVALAVIAGVHWGGLTRGRMPLELLWIPWGAQAACHAVGLGDPTPDKRPSGATEAPPSPPAP